MFPYSSTTMPETGILSESVQVEQPQDAVEALVQGFLSELEQLPPDAQVVVYVRLLNGLALKLTPQMVSKAISAAKDESNAAKKPAAIKGKASTRKSAGADVPRVDSLLRKLNDPTDPVEAWQRYGGSAAQLFDVLREEPTGVLDAMLMHRNMPPGPKPRGKSRDKLAETIALRLEAHYL